MHSSNNQARENYLKRISLPAAALNHAAAIQSDRIPASERIVLQNYRGFPLERDPALTTFQVEIWRLWSNIISDIIKIFGLFPWLTHQILGNKIRCNCHSPARITPIIEVLLTTYRLLVYHIIIHVATAREMASRQQTVMTQTWP